MEENLSNPSETPQPRSYRDVWIELRTATDRIEAIVRMPLDAHSRRIGDIVRQADRDVSGILHLSQATVFDIRTNAVKFHKNSLGVSRQQVIFAAPLEVPTDSKLSFGLTPQEVLNN